MPEDWVQHPVINTEEGSNPGAPLAWGSPENPDDAVAGYGYVAADTSEVEKEVLLHIIDQWEVWGISMVIQ